MTTQNVSLTMYSPGPVEQTQAMTIRAIEISGRTGPMGRVGVSRYTFPAMMEWRVRHNQGTRRIVETLSDTAGNKFFAPVQIVDENEFVVVLTAAMAGSVDVIFDRNNVAEIVYAS